MARCRRCAIASRHTGCLENVFIYDAAIKCGLKDAPILLLDEATSALDTQSEAAIRLAVENITRGRIVIAIADRLSTLRTFDRILMLRDGVIVQDGTHQKLMQVDGFYRTIRSP